MGHSKAYREAYEQVKAVWAGAPTNLTEEDKQELYVPLEGFAGFIPTNDNEPLPLSHQRAFPRCGQE